MITRRNFLKAGAAVAALSVVPNGFASILAKKEKAIGVQLYSVRDDLKTDFDGTMKALVDIGYKRMEAAGYRDGKFYGKSPAEMKKYLADLGAREVGCKWIVQAGYPSKDIKSLSDVKRLADQFNKCGEIAKANGLRFAFHNHVDEFHELEGKIPFDVMIENTDKGLVTFQIDTAQLVYGGFKCHDYVNRYPGRFANWHLKDANADGKGSTEMGAGIVDFKSLFAVAEKAGLEDYFIEQERYNMTPLQAMKHDYDFLMNASYVKW